jgi:hypothetical protein
MGRGSTLRWRSLASVALAAAATVAVAPRPSFGSQGASIPTAVRATLLARALTVARIDGDRHPHDIEVVRTTLGESFSLVCGADCTVGSQDPNEPVYLLAMRGRFTCAGKCSRPGGPPAGPGTVITLEFETPNLRVRLYSLGRHYPRLHDAGVPVRLEPARTRRGR